MKNLYQKRTDTNRYFVADFETTVYSGQERTDVWAVAIVEMFTEDVIVFNNIDDMFRMIENMDSNCVIYFHNLKFDGSFVLQYYLGQRKFEQAFTIGETENTVEKIPTFRMKSGQIKYNISAMGQWYSIIIKSGTHYIEIRDSLKLLPFSVEKIGIDFKTKHKKLSIEYTGFRKPYGIITDEEKSYIENDVLVVKEALEIMFEQKHNELTIGACCLDEYRDSAYLDTESAFRHEFPDLTEISLTEDYGATNAEEYIRNSYRGGWCYVVPEKTNYIQRNGFTLDVNSLYPSMMHSMSGNYFPVGKPTFFKGDVPDKISKYPSLYYYFVRIKCQFNIKDGKLPCIQIKGMPQFYPSTKWLTTSDIEVRDKDGKLTGNYSSVYKDTDGNIQQASVILTLTMTDFKLIFDQYDITYEVLDGCYFYAKKGLFDNYIDKYMKIKTESTGAVRSIAKLFLNNLYGKMATSEDSSFKLARIGEDGALEFSTIDANEKEVIYIPVGTAITSYARNFTIRAAQANYHGKYYDGFIYADTDSIHCTGDIKNVKGVDIDDSAFCKWKHESDWEQGIFVRQKTYAEFINGEWDVKCAGCPTRCKDLFVLSLNPLTAEILKDEDVRAMLLDEYGLEKIEFLDVTRTIKDFKVGLKIPGKLIPRQIPGGVLLEETPFEIRPSFSSYRGG